MEMNRAQEILASDAVIPVQLNGTPVWIEGIDTRTQTVTVHTQGQPSDQRTVKVRELQEVQ